MLFYFIFSVTHSQKERWDGMGFGLAPNRVSLFQHGEIPNFEYAANTRH